MCIVGGAPFQSLVGIPSVCMGEGLGKGKGRSGRQHKKPWEKPCGLEGDLICAAVIGPSSLNFGPRHVCPPEMGSNAGGLKTGPGEGGSTRLQVLAWEGHVGQKSSVYKCSIWRGNLIAQVWW